MTDIHLRILRLVAERTQRTLDQYDAGEPTKARPSTHRGELAKAAARARARVVAAQGRRQPD